MNNNVILIQNGKPLLLKKNHNVDSPQIVQVKEISEYKGITTDEMAMYIVQEKIILKDYVGNLKQCLSDINNNDYKSCNGHKFNENLLYHTSHGIKGEKGNSVSIFGYVKGQIFYIVAIGKHLTSTTYELCYWWQDKHEYLGKDKTFCL